MAARFKKRPPGNDNKLLKLEMLTLYDVVCTICQSIYIEPVTLPCYHDFCLTCFNGTIENNALSCPLCRTRIGSWLRINSKQNNLVNTKLWNFIKQKFPNEIKIKLNGGDLQISREEKLPRLSEPGEIRLEYETEIQKLKRERQLLEEKHSKETQKLIKELQEEERIELEQRLAKLQQDELLARQLAEASQNDATSVESSSVSDHHLPPNRRPNGLKANTLDRYLTNNKGAKLQNGYVRQKSNCDSLKARSGPSPELVSTAGRCGRFLKNFLTVKLWGSTVTGNGPNTSKAVPKVWEPQEVCSGHGRELSVQSGVVVQRDSRQQQTTEAGAGVSWCPEDRTHNDSLDPDTASEDSLAQELCYFKPLHPVPVNRFSSKSKRCIPLRPTAERPSPIIATRVPDMSQFVDGLEKLRGPEWEDLSQSSFVCHLQIPLSQLKARATTKQVEEDMSVSKSNQKTHKTKSPTIKSHTIGRTRSRTKSVSPKKSITKKSPNTHADYGAKKKITEGDVCGKDLRSNGRRDGKTTANDTTPKQSSPRKVTKLQQSRSCVKMGSNVNNCVLTRSKRSISFGSEISTLSNTNSKGNYLSDNTNKVVNGKIHHELSSNVVDGRVLRRNGYLLRGKDTVAEPVVTRRKSHMQAEEDFLKLDNNNDDRKTSLNGSKEKLPRCSPRKTDKLNNHATVNGAATGFVLGNLDPSILEEQRRIEEMIAQEKKDFALAKKLQRQLCRSNYTISTGYTIRTAAKRQATLNEMLPTPKKMKV